MANNLDAPPRASDSFTQEAAPNVDRPLFSHPNNPTDAADFQKTYAAAKASGKDSRQDDPMLKGFEITGDIGSGSTASTDTTSTDSTSSTSSGTTTDSDGDGVADEPVEVTCSEMKQDKEDPDRDDDGVPDDPSGPTSTELKQLVSSVEHGNEVIQDDPSLPAGAVLEQIAKLQDEHERGEDPADIASNPNAIAFSHAGEDSHENIGEPGALSTSQNLTHHFQVKEVGDKRKRQSEAESGQLDVSGLTGAGSDELIALNALKLEARSFAGEATALGPLPQGIDRISIADITTRKEEDGSVVLVAPRRGNSNADRVPIVDKDGFNIKASSLPGFLRPDGTIVMGEDGRAYRPGDNFVAAKPYDQSNNFAVDLNSVERSHMLENTELTSLAGSFADQQIKTSEKISALPDAESEERSEKTVASTSNESTTIALSDMSFEPQKVAEEQAKDAAETQRSVTVRLGETVRQLALRYLDDVKNWPALAEKNNLSTATDERGMPIATLQRGMILNLPTPSELENFQARASAAAALQMT
ncbi:MAG: hypothetical protein JST89_08805 [Cyanobacteria bacterium SZAS-4]|nr:hypothetical protein [Cyanobacteria bacterium SZAS-4]